jgi:hypothetical protein
MELRLVLCRNALFCTAAPSDVAHAKVKNRTNPLTNAQYNNVLHILRETELSADHGDFEEKNQ